jgi:transposase-like protein
MVKTFEAIYPSTQRRLTMPFKEPATISQRLKFVLMASTDNANIRHLCRWFSISPTTGYKWLRRYRDLSLKSLQDLSADPHILLVALAQTLNSPSAS